MLIIENIWRLHSLAHPIYDMMYRELSGDASHVSALSLNRYLIEKTDGSYAVTIRPVVVNDDIDDTLQAASLALHACLDGIHSIFDLPCVKGELDLLLSQYGVLTEASAAAD